MSIKKAKFILLICFCFSCSNSDEKEQRSKLTDQINIENLDLDSPIFNRLNSDKSLGEEYFDFSYNFEQTSLFKRHLNTIGLCIDASNSEYIRRYSYSYKKAGEHAKAMKMLKISIDSEEETKIKLNNLDYAAWNYLYFYRDYKNTIKTVNEILSLTNDNYGISCHGEPCLLLKAQALYRMSEYEEAITVFERFQNNEEEQGFDSMGNFLVVFYKAMCQIQIQSYDKAIRNFSHLISEHPNAEVSFQLAKIYYLTSDFKKAKIHLNNAKKALSDGYTFQEPYFERFDKVFEHNIQELKEKLKQ